MRSAVGPAAPDTPRETLIERVRSILARLLKKGSPAPKPAPESDAPAPAEGGRSGPGSSQPGASPPDTGASSPGDGTSQPTTGPVQPVTAAGPQGAIECSNEPAGFRKQVDIGFGAMPALDPLNKGVFSTEGTRTWYPERAHHFAIVQDPEAPRGNGVLRTEFPAGMQGGAAPAKFQVRRANGDAFESNSGQIYMCMFVKRSARWNDNGNAGTKLFFVLTDVYDSGPRAITHFLSYSHEGRPGGCMESPKLSRCDFFGPAAVDGRWHKLEYLWIAGDPGEPNGIVRSWIDGKLAVSKSDVVMFHAGQKPEFRTLLFDPTYGGGLNPVPVTQYIWLDHLYVSVR